MASTQSTLGRGSFIPVLHIPETGTLYYKIGTDNPVDSPSTPEVARLAAAIIEERFTKLHKREAWGNLVDVPRESKRAFGNVIGKARWKVPREKLFVLLRIQEPTGETDSLARSLKDRFDESLNLMGLQSVDLHANISVSVVVHSKGGPESKEDLDPKEKSDSKEKVDREDFKKAWAELRKEVMGQKDGKRRAQFIGVSKEKVVPKEEDVPKKNETFVLVEGPQPPAINYEQDGESSDLTSLIKECGLRDAFFVRLADIPSNKTIVPDKEEPLDLQPDKLPDQILMEVDVTRQGEGLSSRLVRRLGVVYNAKLEEDRKKKVEEEIRNDENLQMLSPTQKKQQAEKRAAEKDAQVAEQRKQQREGWRKTISRVDKKAEERQENAENEKDTTAKEMQHSENIDKAVGVKVKSFFGWVEKPMKA
ncbi:hypothetical protein CPAR01_01562 [Colletotrichum paranaense]|uniref:Uncharacterized protein n=1 Tax=Colletotrichum paranaense TaxID=1914294 RepID=A0ABQ9T7I3_9PEZI|nr:uncharacterized protein CPAR01_01562 [Colletotrichum paranaense]KAK1547595.1 hypothetical protein CPAR01_01562 [Colletotrichum paranaense]